MQKKKNEHAQRGDNIHQAPGAQSSQVLIFISA